MIKTVLDVASDLCREPTLRIVNYNNNNTIWQGYWRDIPKQFKNKNVRKVKILGYMEGHEIVVFIKTSINKGE